MAKEKTKRDKKEDYHFDEEGDLHLTEIDYDLPENNDNQAFPQKEE